MRGGTMRDVGRRGFTLLELLIVIVIIGIIIALVMVASSDGIRRAEERATQSLIAKLEVAMSDRVDALLGQDAPVTRSHKTLAVIIPAANVFIEGQQRAQVIARFDAVKAELPDVFFVQFDPSTFTRTSPDGGVFYPLNFAALQYPSNASPTDKDNFILPLDSPIDDPVNGLPTLPRPGKGIYGASYAAAAGIYKNLGYHPNGYDGVDNNGNNYIDEWLEGTAALSNADFQTVIARLTRHRNYDGSVDEDSKTARSEMLYALLVEGSGPLGSSMSRDEFTDREVRDTDEDGLPEFVDAWGEPLRFYRWPVYHDADGDTPGSLQKAFYAYGGAAETRQQNPLDPNQQLVAPAWWSGEVNNGGTAPFTPVTPRPGAAAMSGQASEFQKYFVSLTDPGLGNPSDSTGSELWDRAGFFNASDAFLRRAYFSRFLIISSGPDKALGVAQLAFTYPSSAAVPLNALNLVRIENQAARLNPIRTGTNSQGVTPLDPTSLYLQDVSLDDISNQNVQGPGTGVGQ